MKTHFNFWTDPGHGWIEVTAADMNAVDLAPEAISGYSYVKGNTFYLEEDCDASKFIAAYQAKIGTAPQFINKYQAVTFIRTLPRLFEVRR